MSRYQSFLFFVLTVTVLTIACAPAPQPAEQAQAPAPSQPTAPPPPTTPEQKIQNAMSAAPLGIAQDATIMDLPSTPGGSMTELRKGTNGWTCMPDSPDNPVNDPMCMDQVAMQWAHAWMTKQPVNLSGMGIGYMLQGGATADNADPNAMQPKAGSDWIQEPPHIMLFGTKIPPGAFPTTPGDMTGPWVMWGGTPYEHLMVPVK
jgi:hypothetical protein